jgi:hypothetical protein
VNSDVLFAVSLSRWLPEFFLSILQARSQILCIVTRFSKGNGFKSGYAEMQHRKHFKWNHQTGRLSTITVITLMMQRHRSDVPSGHTDPAIRGKIRFFVTRRGALQPRERRLPHYPFATATNRHCSFSRSGLLIYGTLSTGRHPYRVTQAPRPKRDTGPL